MSAKIYALADSGHSGSGVESFQNSPDSSSFKVRSNATTPVNPFGGGGGVGSSSSSKSIGGVGDIMFEKKGDLYLKIPLSTATTPHQSGKSNGGGGGSSGSKGDSGNSRDRERKKAPGQSRNNNYLVEDVGEFDNVREFGKIITLRDGGNSGSHHNSHSHSHSDVRSNNSGTGKGNSSGSGKGSAKGDNVPVRSGTNHDARSAESRSNEGRSSDERSNDGRNKDAQSSDVRSNDGKSSNEGRGGSSGNSGDERNDGDVAKPLPSNKMLTPSSKYALTQRNTHANTQANTTPARPPISGNRLSGMSVTTHIHQQQRIILLGLLLFVTLRTVAMWVLAPPQSVFATVVCLVNVCLQCIPGWVYYLSMYVSSCVSLCCSCFYESEISMARNSKSWKSVTNNTNSTANTRRSWSTTFRSNTTNNSFPAGSRKGNMDNSGVGFVPINTRSRLINVLRNITIVGFVASLCVELLLRSQYSVCVHNSTITVSETVWWCNQNSLFREAVAETSRDNYGLPFDVAVMLMFAPAVLSVVFNQASTALLLTAQGVAAIAMSASIAIINVRIPHSAKTIITAHNIIFFIAAYIFASLLLIQIRRFTQIVSVFAQSSMNTETTRVHTMHAHSAHHHRNRISNRGERSQGSQGSFNFSLRMGRTSVNSLRAVNEDNNSGSSSGHVSGKDEKDSDKEGAGSGNDSNNNHINSNKNNANRTIEDDGISSTKQNPRLNLPLESLKYSRVGGGAGDENEIERLLNLEDHDSSSYERSTTQAASQSQHQHQQSNNNTNNNNNVQYLVPPYSTSQQSHNSQHSQYSQASSSGHNNSSVTPTSELMNNSTSVNNNNNNNSNNDATSGRSPDDEKLFLELKHMIANTAHDLKTVSMCVRASVGACMCVVCCRCVCVWRICSYDVNVHFCVCLQPLTAFMNGMELANSIVKDMETRVNLIPAHLMAPLENFAPDINDDLHALNMCLQNMSNTNSFMLMSINRWVFC
jgi:hypothetical protein